MAVLKDFYIKKNDLQPYYYAQVKDAAGAVVDITGATVRVTLKLAGASTLKIDRATTGITVTDAANGKFQYAWQFGDTNTAGTYHIEFEISPVGTGKFTVPANGVARVIVNDSLDAT